MTGSARHLPWSLVVPIPSTTAGSFSMSRRTLYRALAIALALAAITPLFAQGRSGLSTGLSTPPAPTITH